MRCIESSSNLTSLIAEDISGPVETKRLQTHQESTESKPTRKRNIQAVIRSLKESTITEEDLAKFKNVNFDIPSAGVKIGGVTTEIAQQVSQDCFMALEKISMATAALDLEFMLR